METFWRTFVLYEKKVSGIKPDEFQSKCVNFTRDWKWPACVCAASGSAITLLPQARKWGHHLVLPLFLFISCLRLLQWGLRWGEKMSVSVTCEIKTQLNPPLCLYKKSRLYPERTPPSVHDGKMSLREVTISPSFLSDNLHAAFILPQACSLH